MIDRRDLRRGEAATRAVVLLRLMVGAIFLYAGVGKLAVHMIGGVLPLPVVSLTWQVELPARLASWLGSHPAHLLTPIVRDLLIPNGPLVAALVAWGQALAGVLLFLGLFARAGAALGVLITATLVIAAMANGPFDARPYALLVALCVALFIGRAGATAGLDAWRHERRRDRDL